MGGFGLYLDYELIVNMQFEFDCKCFFNFKRICNELFLFT